MTILLNDNTLSNQKFRFEQTRNIISYNIDLEYADYSILPTPTTLIVKDENNVEIINTTFNSENIFKSVFDNHTSIRLDKQL